MFNYSRRKHSTGILDSGEDPGEKKGKQLIGKPSLNRFNAKVGIPVVALFCVAFFLAGFFASNVLSQDEYRPRTRLLVSVKDGSEKNETGLLENAAVSVRDGSEKNETGLLENAAISVKGGSEKNETGLLEDGGNGHGDNNDDDEEEMLFGIPSKIISWYPRAVYFPDFASEAQCRHIIEISRAKLTPSVLAYRKGETPENTKGIRTSSGMFIGASEDKTGILDIIEEKIERVTIVPRTHYEDFNVLRYEVDQLYKAHYDALDPSEYGPQKSRRVATFLLYLSDVEEGGDTMFPYHNGSNMDGNYDFTECIGLRLKPRQGDALLFYSLYPNGTIDPTSLHGSCPVVKGEKWVATKWIRDQDYDK